MAVSAALRPWRRAGSRTGPRRSRPARTEGWLVGTSVRLTMPIESTGKARLTVPVSAVSLAPDGGSRVQVADGDTFRYVPVETGLSADGFVVVAPAGDARLAVGDRVTVGVESAPAAGG